jgi:hypothetical protein
MKDARSTARALLVGPAIVVGALAGASQAAHAATPVTHPAYASASPNGGPDWGRGRFQGGDPRWGDPRWADPRWGYYHRGPGWGYPYTPGLAYPYRPGLAYPYAPAWGGYWRR